MDVIGLAETGIPVLLHNDRASQLVDVPNALGGNWPADLIAIAASDFDGDGNPDLLIWSEAGGLQLRRGSGNGNNGLKLALTGRRDKGTSLRTTNDAFGALLVVQAGRHWIALENTTFSAGLGRSSTRWRSASAKPRPARLFAAFSGPISWCRRSSSGRTANP